ncbi:hypothetical protein ACXDF8_17270 [Mycolicibacterium sp. CBM1]
MSRHTSRAFTVVLCDGCAGGVDHSWVDALRAVVRACPHGMLVTTTCLLGSGFCATRPGGGVIAMLQPCTADRRPAGPARWVGPIVDAADLTELCDWIMHGRWDLAALPAPLRHPLRQLAHVSRQN